MISALRRIHSSAQTLAHRYASYAPSPRHSTLQTIDLALPPPEPLTQRLVELGIDGQSAEHISSAMLRAVSRIREAFRLDFQRRRQTLQHDLHYFSESQLSLIPTTYTNVYAKAIQDWTSYILDTFAPRVLRARMLHQQRDCNTSRRPFNQDAIPTLEKAFEENAFPSRLEKYELAAKSSMEFRQINTWFQNRRARYKKEGRELKRQASGGVVLEELENSVVEMLLPSRPDDDHISCLQSSLEVNDSLASLDFRPQAPAHAFPSVYPPACSYDPFPNSPEGRAFQLPWIRTCRSSPPIRETVDVSGLTSSFDRLTLGDERPHVSASSVSSSHLTCRPSWFHLGFVTPCARAPHPALVCRAKHVQHSCPAVVSTGTLRESRTPIRIGCRSPPFPLHDSSPQAVSSSLVRRPAKRSLPRRLPHNKPSRPPSHTLHSDCSTSSRSSSVSSKASVSGSEIDSPPQTPQPLASVLPDISHSFKDCDGSTLPDYTLPISSTLELFGATFDETNTTCHITAPLSTSLISACLGFS